MQGRRVRSHYCTARGRRAGEQAVLPLEYRRPQKLPSEMRLAWRVHAVSIAVGNK